MLNIQSLINAHNSLDKGIKRARQDSTDLEVRDACIQRFEYTFELAIKTIKRYIEMEMPISQNIDQLNYRDLLRIADEIGLIQHVEVWFTYREARNQTSHAYDQNKATMVFQVAIDFLEKSRFLIEQLNQKLS
jgi:nucleotidyltransferase substrate binding protein (TIGR01987 family)